MRNIMSELVSIHLMI